jgi:hypothetical protein
MFPVISGLSMKGIRYRHGLSQIRQAGVAIGISAGDLGVLQVARWPAHSANASCEDMQSKLAATKRNLT